VIALTLSQQRSLSGRQVIEDTGSRAGEFAAIVLTGLKDTGLPPAHQGAF
jgi:hypothetical protein